MTTLADLGLVMCSAPGCRHATAELSGVCSSCRRAGYRKAVVADPRTKYTHSSVPGDADVLEATVQQAAIKLLHMHGWKTWRIGQYNAERTQDDGPSDVIAMKPGAGVLFVECKRPVGGVQSPAQVEFEAACRAAGVPYLLVSQMEHLRSHLLDGGRT